MMRAKFSIAILMVVAAVGMAGCPNGGFPDPSSHAAPPSQPTPATPALSTLSSSNAVVGSQSVVITINGTNFQSGAIVNFNGTALTTTFVSSTQVTATIPASALATAGTAQLTASNPGGSASNALTFTVNNPAPALTSLGPSSATAGSAAFTMTLTGTGFANGSAVSFGGTSLQTTFVSATQLTATVPANLIATAGTAGVTVVTAGPGGGTSNSQTFTINNPAPAITTINPNNATAGGAAFSMTVAGTGFVSGSVVHFGATALSTTFVSATQLTAAVPANLISAAGTANVTVVNSTPGGGTSNAVTFTINSSSSDPCGGTGGATLDRIHINLIGPGVGVGKNITLMAIGVFSDGSSQPVVCPVSWSSANTSIATVDPSSGVVTGVAGGVTSVTASVEGGFFTDKAVVNVCSKCDAGIFNDYQFLVESADMRGPQWFVGHIHLSAHPGGKGTLTGIEDVNTSAGVKTNVALTGIYQIFDDGRGDLNLVPDASSGLPAISYRFAMFNDDAQGRMIEFDGKGTAKGELSEGGSSPTLVPSTRFAFGMVGSSPSGAAAALGEVGVFGTDASSNIACTAATCAIDANDNGSVTAAAQLSASSFTAPDSNGRGTVTFSYTNAASQPVTQSFVYYVNGGGQSPSPRLFFVETDAGNMAVGGQAENGGSFVSHNLCDFDSPTSFLLQRPPAVIPPNFDRDDFESVNHWVNDGSCGGNFIDGERDNSDGNMNTGITAGYTLSGTLGRGVVTETSSGGRTFSFYLGAAHDAFLLENSDANAAVGLATPTSGASGSLFSNPLTTSGAPWVIQNSSLTNQYREQLFLLTTDGAGNVSGIGDISQAAPAPQFSMAVVGSYLAPPPPNPDAMGRGQFQDGSLLFVIYGIDTQRGYIALAFLGGTIDSQP